jgi:GDP-mannose 6-dehydrogenase
MRVSVFGLGYVGCVSAACLASRGHRVIGVDVSPQKVDMIARGQAPVVEETIGELTAQVVGSGALTATTGAAEAIAQTDVSLVCVGTPSAPNGSLSTTYLERVCEEIGAAIGAKEAGHVVVIRSTMIPGTCEDLLLPILERASGRTAGEGFGLAVNPEFLREGTSVRDFHDPPKTVIGQHDPASGDVVAELYEGLPGPVFRVAIRVAEATKYLDNAFHALKVGFGNEVGSICKAIGIDSHAAMEIFLADTKLNISPTYLRPGFAFGGSCLPKDLRAIVHLARRHDISVPILENILPSNEEHLRRVFDMVAATGRRRVSIFGLSFKPGTDDLRESPMVELAERLLGKGYDLKIYDANVTLSRLLGANRDYIEAHLPHLGELLTSDIDAALEHAEVCIIGCKDPEVVAAAGRAAGRTVVDLVRLPGAAERRGEPGYVGVGW